MGFWGWSDKTQRRWALHGHSWVSGCKAEEEPGHVREEGRYSNETAPYRGWGPTRRPNAKNGMNPEDGKARAGKPKQWINILSLTGACQTPDAVCNTSQLGRKFPRSMILFLLPQDNVEIWSLSGDAPCARDGRGVLHCSCRRCIHNHFVTPSTSVRSSHAHICRTNCDELVHQTRSLQKAAPPIQPGPDEMSRSPVCVMHHAAMPFLLRES